MFLFRQQDTWSQLWPSNGVQVDSSTILCYVHPTQKRVLLPKSPVSQWFFMGFSDVVLFGCWLPMKSGQDRLRRPLDFLDDQKPPGITTWQRKVPTRHNGQRTGSYYIIQDGENQRWLSWFINHEITPSSHYSYYLHISTIFSHFSWLGN